MSEETVEAFNSWPSSYECSEYGWIPGYYIGHWSSFSYKDGAVEFQLNVGLNYRGIFPKICNGNYSKQNARKFTSRYFLDFSYL